LIRRHFNPAVPHRWHGGLIAKSRAAMDEIALRVRRKLEGDPRFAIHRMFSEDFLKGTNLVFDWAYFDGNHATDMAYSDLILSWTRIRPGGLLSGDDYKADSVRAAVERRAAEINQTPHNNGFAIYLREKLGRRAGCANLTMVLANQAEASAHNPTHAIRDS
jgi:hypothetical protein